MRYAGLKQNEAASTTLWQTIIAGGKHALIAAGESQTFFEGCKLQDCGQDGIIGMQKARVNLTETMISNCKGPAVDMSDESSVVMKQVDVVNCHGGIFLWHKSSCEVSHCLSFVDAVSFVWSLLNRTLIIVFLCANPVHP